MRRLLVPPEQLAPLVQLTAEQQRYLGSVLRLQPGEPIELFDGRGARYSAVLETPAAIKLGARLPDEAARALDLVLAQALAKGEKMELVVQKATELGASRIVPLATERSIVKLEEGRGRERAERWRRIAQEAARQCGRADVPQVDEPKDWAGLFGLLRAEPERRGLLLDPAAPVRLSDAARGLSRVLIAIGPEGGFSLDERESAARAGLMPATLGKLVLRTETAGLAALAILQHLHGELG